VDAESAALRREAEVISAEQRAKMVELDDEWKALESARLTLLRQEQVRGEFVYSSMSVRMYLFMTKNR